MRITQRCDGNIPFLTWRSWDINGYRARCLITFVSRVWRLWECFGGLFSLCYGRSTFGVILEWKFRISMSIHFIYRLALVYVDIALQRRASLFECCRWTDSDWISMHFPSSSSQQHWFSAENYFGVLKSLVASYEILTIGFLHTSYVHALTNKERILMKLSKSTFQNWIQETCRGQREWMRRLEKGHSSARHPGVSLVTLQSIQAQDHFEEQSSF